jgi:GNAT superfamily N-acetyltransferase
MIRIVKATEKDHLAIRSVAYKTWPVTFENILSKKQIDYMLEMMYSITSLTKQMIEEKHIYLLAKEKTRCVGYASYEVNYKGLPKTKIHKVYVLPESQRMGTGSLLINKVAEMAKQCNNDILTLNVNRYNPAVKFYEKTGFYIAAEEDFSIGNGYLMEDYIMEKNLSQCQ